MPSGLNYDLLGSVGSIFAQPEPWVLCGVPDPQPGSILLSAFGPVATVIFSVLAITPSFQCVHVHVCEVSFDACCYQNTLKSNMLALWCWKVDVSCFSKDEAIWMLNILI